MLPCLLQVIAWPIAHAIFRMNGTFVVHGREHLDAVRKSGKSYIMASNHTNDLDPVVQRAIHPLFSKPLFWVARTKNHYNETNTFTGWEKMLYTGWFFRSWGAFPAYKGKQNYEYSLRHHIEILKDGYAIGMFPQGRRLRKERIDEARDIPAHGGCIFLAKHIDIPILPVVIYGTKGMNAIKLFIKRSAIEVRILPPVYFEKGKEIDYKTEAQKIMNAIYAAIPQA